MFLVLVCRCVCAHACWLFPAEATLRSLVTVAKRELDRHAAQPAAVVAGKARRFVERHSKVLEPELADDLLRAASRIDLLLVSGRRRVVLPGNALGNSPDDRGEVLGHGRAPATCGLWERGDTSECDLLQEDQVISREEVAPSVRGEMDDFEDWFDLILHVGRRRRNSIQVTRDERCAVCARASVFTFLSCVLALLLCRSLVVLSPLTRGSLTTSHPQHQSHSTLPQVGALAREKNKPSLQRDIRGAFHGEQRPGMPTRSPAPSSDDELIGVSDHEGMSDVDDPPHLVLQRQTHEQGEGEDAAPPDSASDVLSSARLAEKPPRLNPNSSAFVPGGAPPTSNGVPPSPKGVACGVCGEGTAAKRAARAEHILGRHGAAARRQVTGVLQEFLAQYVMLSRGSGSEVGGEPQPCRGSSLDGSALGNGAKGDGR